MTITSPAKVTFKKIEKLSLRTESDVWRRSFCWCGSRWDKRLRKLFSKKGKTERIMSLGRVFLKLNLNVHSLF